MTEELIKELKEKEFVNSDSLLELDKLLESIIASIKENYTSTAEDSSVKFVVKELEESRIKKLDYLEPEGISIEAETFNNIGTSALAALESFYVLVMSGEVVHRDSGQ